MPVPRETVADLPVQPSETTPITTPGGNPLRTAQAGAGPAIKFIGDRGGHKAGEGAPDLQPEFAARLAAAGEAYERETGQRAAFEETGRSYDVQAKYRRAFESGQGGLAARPGTGRHEIGQATDIPDGPFQNWMHRNARRFGLQGLNDPRDPNHFQLDRTYSGPQFASL
jgi:hypothetical protein